MRGEKKLKPQMIDRFNPSSGKYEYVVKGHIGTELFKNVCLSEYYVKIDSSKIKRTYEDNAKVTKGFS